MNKEQQIKNNLKYILASLALVLCLLISMLILIPSFTAYAASASPNSYTFGSASGSYDFTVTGYKGSGMGSDVPDSAAWNGASISSSASWATTSKPSTGKLRVTVGANSGARRTATISIYTAGGNCTIAITQSAGTTTTTTTTTTTPRYSINYNTNGTGVTNMPSNQTGITSGSTVNLSSTKPARTGYTFQGWATSASGTVAYQPGNSVRVTGNINLYAVWQAGTVTITWNNNYFLGGSTTSSKTVGTSMGTLPTRSRSGYDFDGWYTSASGGTRISSSTVVPTTNTTYYARWTAKTTAKPTVTSATGTKGTSNTTTTAKSTTATTATTKPTVPTTTAKVKASSISVSPSSVVMYVGDTRSLSVTFNPSSTSDKSVKWSIGLLDWVPAAKVSSNGVVTAVRPGTTTVTATAQDGSGKKASCVVTVYDKVTINAANQTFTCEKGSKTVSVSNYKPKGVTSTDATCWGYVSVSSNQTWCTVSKTSTGLITVKVDPHISTASNRTATITIKSSHTGVIQKQITITQEKAPPKKTLTVNPLIGPSFTYNDTSSKTITVYNYVPVPKVLDDFIYWGAVYISSKPDWVTVSKFDSGKLSVKVMESTFSSSRSGTIVISSPYANSVSVTVVQGKAEPSTLSLSATRTSVPDEIKPGDKIEVKGTITSNYTISTVYVGFMNSSQKWIAGSYKTINPNKKDYNLSNVNTEINTMLAALPTGTYYFAVDAADTKMPGGKRLQLSKQFEVKSAFRFTKNSGVDIANVDSRLMSRLRDMGIAYKLTSINITSGYRSYEKQKELYDGYIQGKPGYNPANPPGESWHEYGGAVDITVWDKSLTNEDFKKYGLSRPAMPAEPWHIQISEIGSSAKASSREAGLEYFNSITKWG